MDCRVGAICRVGIILHLVERLTPVAGLKQQIPFGNDKQKEQAATPSGFYIQGGCR
jgi:hypothetical protein